MVIVTVTSELLLPIKNHLIENGYNVLHSLEQQRPIRIDQNQLVGNGTNQANDTVNANFASTKSSSIATAISSSAHNSFPSGLPFPFDPLLSFPARPAKPLGNPKLKLPPPVRLGGVLIALMLGVLLIGDTAEHQHLVSPSRSYCTMISMLRAWKY